MGHNKGLASCGIVELYYLDNGGKERLDVTGGMQGGLSALQEAQQQWPVCAGPAHCCNVYLTLPHLHSTAAQLPINTGQQRNWSASTQS